MDLGVGELIDRVEKHIGSFLTKVLVFAFWIAAMAFCLKTTFDYVVAPLLKVGPDLYTALGWADVFRIALTIAIGAVLASLVLDAYRIKMMSREYEESTGRASELLDEMDAFRTKASRETGEVMKDARSLVSEAYDALKHALEIRTSSVLLAEELYEFAAAGNAIPKDRLPIIREILDIAQKETSELGSSVSRLLKLPAPDDEAKNLGSVPVQ